jgi:hypothetical protein
LVLFNVGEKKQLKDKGNTVGVALIADLSVLTGVCIVFFFTKKSFINKICRIKKICRQTNLNTTQKEGGVGGKCGGLEGLHAFRKHGLPSKASGFRV